MGYYAANSVNFFKDQEEALSSRPLNMGPIGCPETSETN